MNKKQLTFFISVLVFIIGASIVIAKINRDNRHVAAVSLAEQSAVTQTVSDFGHKLQLVSLLAPSSDLKESMDREYGPYVAPELLSLWKSDPMIAPGRIVSSPWPDRIEISHISLNADGSYSVSGTVVEVTSTEAKNGTALDTYPVTMTLQKRNGIWLITAFHKGAINKIHS